MIVFALFWLSKKEYFDLPLINVKVKMDLAIALAPSFISILTARYLYLCAHTILSYVTYLNRYIEVHKEELNNQGISFTILHATFKQRDLTENINVFLFPVKGHPDWDKEIHKAINISIKFLINIGIILTVIVPLMAYMLSVTWLGINLDKEIFSPYGIWLFAFYLFLGSLFLLFPIYLFYRVKPARKIMKLDGMIA
jgi:hypothetical protein